MRFRKPKKSSVKNIAIIALLIIFFPVGLFLMWKHSSWSKKAKWIISGSIVCLIIIGSIGAYYSPPTITVAGVKNNKISTDKSDYTLTGSISSLKDATLTINDQLIPISDNSKFNYRLLLEEGDNTFNLVSSNKNGEYNEAITIHRTNQAEFSERQEAESLAIAIRTEEVRKKEAEANAKAEETTKVVREKDIKKAETEKKAQDQKLGNQKVTQKSKSKKRSWFHWPVGKKDQVKEKEKAEQAKVAQGKVTAAADARKAIIDRIAPIYCAKRQSVKVKLTAEGEANGWPGNTGAGWTNDKCTNIITKLFVAGATEEELGLVVEGKYAIGMHEMSLLYSVGSPRDINTTRYANYKTSQYVYGDPLYNATYVYVDNGLVTAVQN